MDNVLEIAEELNPELLDVQRTAHRHGKALVLSGGGALGAFQAGAIKRLYESGYEPDLICGISVGALNAVKLAEGDTSGQGPAARLEELWNRLADGALPVLREWAGVQGVERRIRSLMERHVVGITAAGTLVPPPFDIGAIAGPAAALPGRVMADAIHEASRVHALHSLGGGQPDGYRGLLDLIGEHTRPDLIAQSGIKLRIGSVDLETGSLWMATEPRQVMLPEPDGGRVPAWRCQLEREPDLSRHLTDPRRTRHIDLAWATYASAAMPVFFPPVEAFENSFGPNESEISCRISPDFMASMAQQDGGPSAPNPWKHLFDGGLADIVPIRTAMRLGYRDITVIGASPLHKSEWRMRAPTADEPLTAPILQYLMAFIGTWGANVARSDMNLALAHNEFLGWLYRLETQLSSELSQQVRTAFEAYWGERRHHWANVLGSTSWLGGSIADGGKRKGFDYGRPFADEGCQISVVAPRDPLPVDVLGFTDAANLRLTMARGYDRMSELLADPAQMRLSYPVQPRQLRATSDAVVRGL